MAFDAQTVSEIRDLLLAAKAVQDPELDTSEGSDAWLDANAQATRINELQVRSAEVHDAILPSTATGDDLDAHGEVWGVTRLDETTWEGYVNFTADPAGSTPTIAIGTTFTHADGTQYETTAIINPADWGGGTASTTAESITTGTVANKASATAVTVDSPPAGCSASATLGATTTSAIDTESDTDYRERIVFVTSKRPGAGNAADYMAWAQTHAAVGDCYVYPRWDGLATVTVVPLGTGSGAARFLVPTTIAEIQTIIDGERPCGATITVEAPTTLDQQIIVTVTPEDGYEPDWEGTLTEKAGTSTKTRVYTTTNPASAPNFMSVGDRVVCHNALTGWEERTVSLLHADGFTVSVQFADPVTAGSTVRPGGPLVSTVWAAVDALVDSLGTSTSTDSAKQRWPSPTSEHPSTLYFSKLTRAIVGVTGVLTATVTTPAANVTNTAAPGAGLQLISRTVESYIVWA